MTQLVLLLVGVVVRVYLLNLEPLLDQVDCALGAVEHLLLPLTQLRQQPVLCPLLCVIHALSRIGRQSRGMPAPR